MGTLAISVVVAGLVHDVVPGTLAPGNWSQEVALVAAATVYFLANTGLVGFVIAASSRDTVRRIWKREFLWSSPSYYIGAGLAFIAVGVASGGRHWWAAVFALPAYLIFRSYETYTTRLGEEQRQVRESSDVQLALIQALAQAIEAKDNMSHDHLGRMQIYAEGLARALEMTEGEIRAVKTATLLHDIGNLAVPERILSKPGRLSYDEFDRLKVHPGVGAKIIRSVPFPIPVAPLVLAHHERWDGRGYPNGLKGEDIPPGARIIAVVDCFTSMLTDRPYRPARTYAEAIATLRENCGSALDPAMAERFIEILPSIESHVHAERAEKPATETAAGADAPVSALADIAVTHREEQVLRDIAQSLGSSLRVSDALSLISTKLVTLMPVDSCALFPLDQTSGLFMCSRVVGRQQDGIRTITGSTVESLGDFIHLASASKPGTATRVQSAIVAPLATETGTFGALAIYHSERNSYNASQRGLFARIAAHAADVIANAIVFEETQEQSLTDVLTGLPNRRYLDRHLSQELARVQRHGVHLSVLVLDMDGFKQINDEFGHQTGDQALAEVSQVLRGSLRVYDICARLAGDEFVLVLGNCDTAQAEIRRADLQRAIAAVWIEPLPGRTVRLSVSAGAATFPDEAGTGEELIALADRRMYQDKAARKQQAGEPQPVATSQLWT
jgi:diguanylate cyclase (GGDEF)-like protein